MKKVLITRAEPAASDTAQRLAELGFKTVVMPLFERRNTGNIPPRSGFCAVALTSANAVAALLECGWFPDHTGLPFYCIGSRTVKAAKELRHGQLFDAGGDRDHMVDLIRDNHAGAKEPVLYPSAVHRSFDLEEALAKHAIQSRVIDMYAMEKIVPPDGTLQNALRRLNGGYVPVYSRRSARHIADLLTSDGPGRIPDDVRFVVISKQAAQPIEESLGIRVLVAKQPSEQALIEEMAS